MNQEANREGSNRREITEPHEEQFYVTSQELVGFLRDLADQVEKGNELTISTDNWDLPFTFQEKEIEVEVERDRDELEIEIEFDEHVGKKGLSVEG